MGETLLRLENLSIDYKVKDGDKIQWSYTCDLGEDIKAKAGGEQ